MSDPPYCFIQNEKTKDTFIWLGKTREEGKWLRATEEEYEGFKEFNEIISNSKNPLETLRFIVKEWKENGMDPLGWDLES
jgi:hypothetical protein